MKANEIGRSDSHACPSSALRVTGEPDKLRRAGHRSSPTTVFRRQIAPLIEVDLTSVFSRKGWFLS